MMKRIFPKTIIAFLLLSFSFISYAQTNTDSIKGVINRYAQVTAFDICDARITVSDTVGFSKGTRLIICQMNGAAIKTTNNSDFGALND